MKLQLINKSIKRLLNLWFSVLLMEPKFHALHMGRLVVVKPILCLVMGNKSMGFIYWLLVIFLRKLLVKVNLMYGFLSMKFIVENYSTCLTTETFLCPDKMLKTK